MRVIKMQKAYDQGKCIICKKLFFKNKRKKHDHQRRQPYIRPSNYVTCSKKCARIYRSFNETKRKKILNKLEENLEKC